MRDALPARRWRRLRRVCQIALECNGFGCHYCTSPMRWDAVTFDHIVPQAIGGKSGAYNLVLACEGCNWLLADRLVKCRCDRCRAALWRYLRRLTPYLPGPPDDRPIRESGRWGQGLQSEACLDAGVRDVGPLGGGGVPSGRGVPATQGPVTVVYVERWSPGVGTLVP